MALENITEAQFPEAVLNRSGLTLVDFWAPWCGPCRMLAPTLEKVAAERGDQVKIVKVNIDENPAIANQYKVMNIPLIMLFKDGDVAGQLLGNNPKSKIDGLIDGAL